jgi:quinol monooxygenase YgiN
MAFIQIIEARTKDADRMLALNEEWQQSTAGKRTARRAIVTRDRNDPDRYVIVVFFDSYESAMENSNLPQTQEFSEKMAAALDSPASFSDLDVLADHAD